jgi:signal transduction histidine kinase
MQRRQHVDLTQITIRGGQLSAGAPTCGKPHGEVTRGLQRIVVGACLLMAVGADASASDTPPGVLILYPNHRTLPTNVLIDEVLRREVPKGLGEPVAVYSEFLDVEGFANETYNNANALFVREKYRDRNIKAFVAIGPRGLQFVLRYRDQMLPNVPVVYSSISQQAIREFKLPADVVGEASNTNDDASLALALRLHPNAKRIHVVTGAATQDRRWERQARLATEKLSRPVVVEFMAGLPTADVLQRLRTLTSESIVYTPGYFLDGAGTHSTPSEAAERMASVSGAPLYSRTIEALGAGAVGGYMTSRESQSIQAAAIVVRLMQGTAPTEITASSIEQVPMFDWRQLQHWGIDEAQLPPGSIVKFREPSVWQLYQWHIVTAALVLLLQAVFITALLVERRRRQTAEVESHKRLGEMAHLNRSVALGEISASLAHELNQPLGAILNNAGAAEMLIRSGAPVSQQLNEILADIRRDNQRASDVIARLRAMLRKSAFEILDVDLNAAVQDVARFVASEASVRHVALRMELEPSLPSVRGDRVQLQQVVLNLALNGMDAMGGQAAESRKMVIRTGRVNGSEAQISVADSGIGIPEDKLARIFEPFVTTKAQGMGLGLSISRTIVEAHGGRIWAEHAAHRGAVLRFTVPLASAS